MVVVVVQVARLPSFASVYELPRLFTAGRKHGNTGNYVVRLVNFWIPPRSPQQFGNRQGHALAENAPGQE
jgi:hypothetical protein